MSATENQKRLQGQELTYMVLCLNIQPGKVIEDYTLSQKFVDKYKSSVAPWDGCDIIIDGQSSSMDKVIEREDQIEDMDMYDHTRSYGTISALVYCVPELQDKVINEFEFRAVEIIKGHMKHYQSLVSGMEEYLNA